MEERDGANGIELTNAKVSSICSVLFLVSLLVSSQSSFAIIGLPHYASQNGISSAELSALLSSFPLATAIAALLSGPVSDLCGRRSMLLFGLAGLGFALVAHQFTTSISGLVAIRTMTGIACGALSGLPSVLLSDHFPDELQRPLIGKSLVGYALGQTICLPIGMFLIDRLGYLQLNATIGGIALALFPVAAMAIPRTSGATRAIDVHVRIRDYTRQAALSMRCPKLRLIALVSFLSFVSTSAFYVTLTIFLYEEMKLSPAELAPMYLAAGVLQALALTGRIQSSKRLSAATLVGVSFLATGILIALTGPIASVEMSLFPVFAAVTGSVAWRIPTFQQFVNNLGSKSQKGLRMSIVQSSNNIGRAIGATAAITLATCYSFEQRVFAIGLTLVPCGIAFLAFFPQSIAKESLTQNEAIQDTP